MLRRFWLVLGCALAAAGCGAGGGSSTPPVAPGGLQLFLSDTLSGDYSHVWIRIYKVELHHALQQAVYTTVFSDADGILFDAARLHDALGPRFLFLKRTSVPQGTYDQARVTLDAQVILVRAGAIAAQKYPLDSTLPRDADGHVPVSYTIQPAYQALDGVPESQIVDFPLSTFVLSGTGEVVPALAPGSRLALDDEARHDVGSYSGTVNSLGAASFRLDGTAGSIPVRYDATTPVFSRATGLGAALADGRSAEVDGVYSTTDDVLLATSIRILDGGASAEASGSLSQLDLVANRMTLAGVYRASGFVPEAANVNVTWTEATVFRLGEQMVDETWLWTHPYAEVDGVFDAASNSILAMRVSLDDGGGRGLGDPRVGGQTTLVDLSADGLTLTNLTGVEGFTPGGTTLGVSWTAATLFRRGGDVVDATWLNSFAQIEVQGYFHAVSNTFEASRISLVDAANVPLPQGQSQASGAPTSVDLGTQTCVLFPVDAVEGFAPSGTSVAVAWDVSTQFLYHGVPAGDSDLLSHARARVRGTYDAANSVLHAVAVEILD